MGKSTISMAIFNSYVTNYQRVCSFVIAIALLRPLSHRLIHRYKKARSGLKSCCQAWDQLRFHHLFHLISIWSHQRYGYGSIPINTIFSGMNIHLPAILMFTRCQGFDTSPYQSLGKAMTIQTWFPSSSTTSQMCSSVRWAKPPVASQRSRGGMFEVGDLHQSIWWYIIRD